MHKTILNAQNLNIAYDKKPIVSNISLKIDEGQIVGLIGPSGSGKSTIIKAFIGSLKPTTGELFVLDFKMPSLKPIEQIGYMAQADALYDDLSGYDNLLFFGRLYKMNTKDLKQRIDDVLKLTHLSEDAKKLVRHYSSGMKRRLSMAISFLNNPKLLILDEPTVGLDPILRVEFKELFKEFRENGISILMTTHVMDEVNDCDMIYMLRDGKIIANGTPKEFIGDFGSVENAFLNYTKDKG